MAEKPRVTKADYIPCPKCGELNHPNLTWCERCGKLLAAAPSGEEWVSWVLLVGVVTVSLLGSVLPAWQLVGQGDLFCLGTLGMVLGCGGLLIWLLSRIRSTQRPDWVSLIAVGVIMVSAAVLIVSVLPVLAAGMDSPSSVLWRDYANADDWIPRVPTAVASLGYVVLVVRRLERALRWKTRGALWSSVALIIIVIVATIIASSLVLSQPRSMPVPVTTVPTAKPWVPDESGMVICSGMLTITLDAVPQDYYLELVSSGGDKARVRCVDGQTKLRVVDGKSAHYISCIDRGVRWRGPLTFSTVTVTWNERQIVQRLEPSDEVSSDRRETTPCISESITVTIPISP